MILPNEHGEDDGTISFFKGDVTDIASLQEIFSNLIGYEVVVIHAAGIVSIESRVIPLLFKVNVLGTKNIIELCLINNVHKLIYVSSVHAIPSTKKIAEIKEVTNFSPNKVIGPYAKTKAEATQAVLEAVEQGLNAVVVHPSGIIGPYDNGNNHIVKLAKDYISGKLLAGVIGGYDFVDVRDVAKGCIAAVDKGEVGECYILSNRFFTVKELLEYMQIASNGPKKICVPISLAKIMLPMIEWIAKIKNKRPLFTKYSLYTLESNGHFSHEKATKALAYHPREMRTTIADTIHYLQGRQVPLLA